MRTRDDRRRQRARIQLRATEFFRAVLGREASSETQRQIVRWAAHRPRCSRSCCGNPRRWLGLLTRQELRANINDIEVTVPER